MTAANASAHENEKNRDRNRMGRDEICSKAAGGSTQSPTCLPFVCHILDAVTPVWDPWFYTSYSFVPACPPFVSDILDALTLVCDPWFYTSYSFVSHLSPICLPHSGCCNARLGPLVLHVILICLPLVSHLSPTFWML